MFVFIQTSFPGKKIFVISLIRLSFDRIIFSIFIILAWSQGELWNGAITLLKYLILHLLSKNCETVLEFALILHF
jgi:hypothetical protein